METAGSLEAGSDVDHRSLTDILATRVADIDHRNLISLTGSPRETETASGGDKLSEDVVSDLSVIFFLLSVLRKLDIFLFMIHRIFVNI